MTEMENPIIEGDELDLESRITRNALARRASRTVNKVLLTPLLLTKKQRDEIRKTKNPGRRYETLFKLSLKDNMVQAYLGILSMECASAAVEAATLKVMRDPETTYEAEIPAAVTRKDYKEFMKVRPHEDERLRETLNTLIEEKLELVVSTYGFPKIKLAR